MSISRKRAQDYAERVLQRPRAEHPVTLRRGKGGVTLLYRGKAVTRCHASGVGTQQAMYMAQALGVELPSLGAVVKAVVPGGVLYRAIAISCLDLRKPEARVVLGRLLLVAEAQRRLLVGPG